MIKKLSALIVGISMLFFVACTTDPSVTPDNTQIPAPIVTSSPEASATPTDDTNKPIIKVFNTENIVSITFYPFYGMGKGIPVPSDDMEEIVTWLSSFTIGVEAPEITTPGTNTYHVEIEYSDGTVIKKGLDVVSVDEAWYCTERAPSPNCFTEIIEKATLE